VSERRTPCASWSCWACPSLRASVAELAVSARRERCVPFVPALAENNTIRVTPVLLCAPVFWTPKFWAESAHAWDEVRSETPLDDKPWAELEVSLDVTLGEVFEVACDAWGIELGPDPLSQGDSRLNHFHRFNFVRPDRDAAGVDDKERNEWPSHLPIARESGDIELVFGTAVTFRELLASSSLGLIEGDVTRPYVDPVMPQGELESAIEVGRLTIEAIRAAYGAVDDAFGYGEHTVRLIRASLPEVHDAAATVID
jgi:hypothetical protein